MKNTLKRMRIALPAALIALPLLFTVPASAADYTATASASCHSISGSPIGYCDVTHVALPSDKTWVSTSSGFISGSALYFYPVYAKSGSTSTSTFTLTDSDGDKYTLSVTISY